MIRPTSFMDYISFAYGFCLDKSYLISILTLWISFMATTKPPRHTPPPLHQFVKPLFYMFISFLCHNFVSNSVPRGLEDVSKFPNLIAALIKRGWSEENIKKLIGGNLLRAMRQMEDVSNLMLNPYIIFCLSVYLLFC